MTLPHMHVCPKSILRYADTIDFYYLGLVPINIILKSRVVSTLSESSLNDFEARRAAMQPILADHHGDIYADPDKYLDEYPGVLWMCLMLRLPKDEMFRLFRYIHPVGPEQSSNTFNFIYMICHNMDADVILFFLDYLVSNRFIHQPNRLAAEKELYRIIYLRIAGLHRLNLAEIKAIILVLLQKGFACPKDICSDVIYHVNDIAKIKQLVDLFIELDLVTSPDMLLMSLLYAYFDSGNSSILAYFYQLIDSGITPTYVTLREMFATYDMHIPDLPDIIVGMIQRAPQIYEDLQVYQYALIRISSFMHASGITLQQALRTNAIDIFYDYIFSEIPAKGLQGGIKHHMDKRIQYLVLEFNLIAEENVLRFVQYMTFLTGIVRVRLQAAR